MDAEEFVRMWRTHADGATEELFAPESQRYFGEQLRLSELSPEQIERIKGLIRIVVLEDHFNFLLALDGGTSLSGVGPDGRTKIWHDHYQVFASRGESIYARGELAAAARRWFPEL
jgi:hypothetical protein